MSPDMSPTDMGVGRQTATHPLKGVSHVSHPCPPAGSGRSVAVMTAPVLRLALDGLL
jgi:hypothetical protein